MTQTQLIDVIGNYIEVSTLGFVACIISYLDMKHNCI